MYNPPPCAVRTREMKLSFRPHHFLCTLGFQGKGYSPGFIKNYHSIVEALRENDDLMIEVVSRNDSICKACPHKSKDSCETEPKIRALDERHAHILNLHIHDRLTWKEAKERLRYKMTLEAFHTACKGCAWKDLGVCETALVNLHTAP